MALTSLEEAVLKLMRELPDDNERSALFAVLMLSDKEMARMGMFLSHSAALRESQRENVLDILELEFCAECGEELPPEDSDVEHFCPEDEGDDDDGEQ